MNNLDVVITGAQGEGKSRLARDIMRQVLPSAARVKDFADIDDLVEIEAYPKSIFSLFLYLKNTKAKFIIFDNMQGQHQTDLAKACVADLREAYKLPVFAIYVKQALLALLLSLSLISCSKKLEPRYAGCVEQEVKLVYNESEMYLFTYVWYKDQVISCNRDLAETVSEPLASERRKDGLELLKTVKSINAKTEE